MAPTNELTKIEAAAISIAAGVHGTVPKEHLAKTSVSIAAEVLAECERWTKDQAEAAAAKKAETKHESHSHA